MQAWVLNAFMATTPFSSPNFPTVDPANTGNDWIYNASQYNYSDLFSNNPTLTPPMSMLDYALVMVMSSGESGMESSLQQLFSQAPMTGIPLPGAPEPTPAPDIQSIIKALGNFLTNLG